MEDCYAVLGISPTATAEEIETAYLAAKRAVTPEAFPEGSAERLKAIETRTQLEKAYNQAIMATFGPVRVGGPSVSAPVRTVEPRPSAPRPMPSPSPSMPPRTTFHDSETLELDNLVEEVPVSFSDEQLLSMSIDEIRGNLTDDEESTKGGLLAILGIKDPLMRYYVATYLLFTLLDIFGRLAQGPMWNGVESHLGAFLRKGLPAEVSLQLAMAALPPPSALWSILSSTISIFYLFLCSLIMPIVVRFFICGQPVERELTRVMVCTLSVIVAIFLYRLTGFLFRFLPAEWGGSVMSLAFIAPALCWRTIKYQGK